MKINFDSKKLSSLQPSELDQLTRRLEEALEKVEDAWWDKKVEFDNPFNN